MFVVYKRSVADVSKGQKDNKTKQKTFRFSYLKKKIPSIDAGWEWIMKYYSHFEGGGH